MRAEVQALVLAGVAALTFDTGILLLKARGDRLPPLRWRAGLAVLRAYGGDPLWVLGLFLQPAGYGLYLWALELGPLAIVQPVMSAGIVLFVAFAVLILGERIHPSEWAAIGAVGLGLLLLGSSLAPEGELAAAGGGAWAVGGYSAAILVAAGAASAGWARGRATGVALGIWSGALLGLASLYAKGLASVLSRSGEGPWLAALVGEPYLYLTAIGNVLGFGVLLSALRNCRAGVVFTLSSTLSNVVPILGGMAAMGERLPEGPVAGAIRVASLMLTLGGAAYLARFDPAGRAGVPCIVDTPGPV
jgi:uncharacterized membrane protein